MGLRGWMAGFVSCFASVAVVPQARADGEFAWRWEEPYGEGTIEVDEDWALCVGLDEVETGPVKSSALADLLTTQLVTLDPGDRFDRMPAISVEGDIDDCPDDTKSVIVLATYDDVASGDLHDDLVTYGGMDTETEFGLATDPQSYFVTVRETDGGKAIYIIGGGYRGLVFGLVDWLWATSFHDTVDEVRRWSHPKRVFSYPDLRRRGVKMFTFFGPMNDSTQEQTSNHLGYFDEGFSCVGSPASACAPVLGVIRHLDLMIKWKYTHLVLDQPTDFRHLVAMARQGYSGAAYTVALSNLAEIVHQMRLRGIDVVPGVGLAFPDDHAMVDPEHNWGAIDTDEPVTASSRA